MSKPTKRPFSPAKVEHRAAEIDQGSVSRRGFLEATGFSLAAAALTGCSRGPVKTAVPYVAQPDGMVPGRAEWYASTCAGCSAGCGLLVKTREGRPIKLEGNPDHPVSGGGLCAVGQASLIGVYDTRRLKEPKIEDSPVDWTAVDQKVSQALQQARDRGGRIRLLTGTVNGPTDLALIDRLVASFGAQHVAYDAVSCSAILDAHERSHGHRLLPQFRFDRAELIVSFDADFLGTWISPVEFAAAYTAGRTLSGSPPKLSRHVQFESRMSLTGANADQRMVLAPSELGSALWGLASELAELSGTSLPLPALTAVPALANELKTVAEELWHAHGKALVVCGSQSLAEQLLCNWINQVLGSYGNTLDVERPSMQRLGDDRALEELVAELGRGEVEVLLTCGVNPVYDLPQGDRLATALDGTGLVVSISSHDDETTAHADVVCPQSHALECWRDDEPHAGVKTLTQPVIGAVYSTRTLSECLSSWVPDGDGDIGDALSTPDLIRSEWRRSVLGELAEGSDFESAWSQAVHDGFVQVSTAFAAPVAVAGFSLETPSPSRGSAGEGELELVLYPKVGQLDGKHAHNPWLHELPDPVTKVCWSNYACLAPETAAARDIETGDLVRLEVGGESLELPALVQIGQHPSTVAVAVGYGRAGTDRFTDVGPEWLEAKPSVEPNGSIGVRANGLGSWSGGERLSSRSGAVLTRLPGGKVWGGAGLAMTQTTASLTPKGLRAPIDGSPRPMVQETTVDAYELDETSGKPPAHHFDSDLWPEHETPGHHWGIAIDLNVCNGCSGCVVACQAENNVPVVGRDEVLRRREMHWIRIDRYYDDDGDTAFQPMMCQQCDNAPCETVCPVVATVHSAEGLNQQVYNRCVGTRYCANNCPYKVRRFNWFNYPHKNPFENLVLNPDVVVRTRGIMEKCTFCVQRIEDAKISAKVDGRKLVDGEIQPACQQSCPTGAIVFGDMNDPESEVSRLARSGRHFRVLDELNVKPSVGYLRRVRNRSEHSSDQGHSAGTNDDSGSESPVTSEETNHG